MDMDLDTALAVLRNEQHALTRVARAAGVVAELFNYSGDLATKERRILDLEEERDGLQRAVDAAALAVAVDPRASVMVRVVDALMLIDRHGCERQAGSRCSDPGKGYTRGASTGYADAWCEPCVAADALSVLRASITEAAER